MTKVRSLVWVVALLVLMGFVAGCGQVSDQARQGAKKKAENKAQQIQKDAKQKVEAKKQQATKNVQAKKQELKEKVGDLEKKVNDLKKDVTELQKKINAHEQKEQQDESKRWASPPHGDQSSACGNRSVGRVGTARARCRSALPKMTGSRAHGDPTASGYKD